MLRRCRILLADLLRDAFTVAEERGASGLVGHARKDRFDLPAAQSRGEQALDEDNPFDRFGLEAPVLGRLEQLPPGDLTCRFR